ncbi:G_PROTEIN_RECEP_F1_2 domain-containing protein [Meloidogyne graminicola]|uniref:G_PROTEIN_RECEP_F1_2 domain-containing protein n=1 Tax=Meloidogyne graminicola TaxID=189291 RepID=A0A8S9ZQZ6_9BILA|nr:G_PROTEIN_RECEP_F1_2 domain-containing protein [Meloidogyne graminicola]
MFLSIEDIDRQCPRSVYPNDTINWQLSPFDDGCLKSFFHKLTSHLRRYYVWETALYTSFYVLISICAIIGNGLVIIAVVRKPAMRTARNVLIVNLALSNLMLALTTVPFLWLPSIDFDFPYSNFFCKFANALPGSNIYCSTLTISVMAIDRYYSVKSIKVSGPSNKSKNNFRALLISIFIWVLSLLLSFPLLIYYQINMLYAFKDIYVFNNELISSEGNKTSFVELRSYGWRQCRLSTTNDNDKGNETFIDERMVQLGMSLMQALMLYAVPLIVLLIFNLKLTRFLEKNSKNMNNRMKKVNTTTQINKIEKNERRESDNESLSCTEKLIEYYSDGQQQQKGGGGNSSTKSGSLVSSGGGGGGTTTINLNQFKKSLGGNLINNQKKRRNKTTFLLITMAGSYAFLWLPFTLISFLIDLDLMEGGSPTMERVDQACKLISILSICVNPFLYGFLNTNFRSEFNEIFIKCINCLPLIIQNQLQNNKQKNLNKIQIIENKKKKKRINNNNNNINNKRNYFDKNKDIIL